MIYEILPFLHALPDRIDMLVSFLDLHNVLRLNFPEKLLNFFLSKNLIFAAA